MKILSATQIRKADQYTIRHEPIESIQLMERASARFVEWFLHQYPKRGKAIVFCGTGNNGGDGLAISRMLLLHDWKVDIYVVKPSAKQSTDFKINYLKLNQVHEIHSIESKDDLDFDLAGDEIVIDAIFGSGLSRKITGIHAQVIKKINETDAETVSVDIPSGMFADKSSSHNSAVVQANHVVSFQLPKLAFFLPENGQHIEEFHVADIGLHHDFLEAEKTKYFTLEKNDLAGVFTKRSKHAFKNQFGHALLIAGSYGKMGAALLASKACLRSGAGLLTAHVPQCGYAIVQTALPEAMVSADTSERFVHSLPDLTPYSAIGIGPGLDRHPHTVEVLEMLLQHATVPLVIDADALNIVSEYPDLKNKLPAYTVITPHPGEFRRLAGAWKNDFERLEMQRKWSTEYRVIVVLKGAYTSVSLPDGTVYFNTTGNPGMATAGSGDVLTGIITGLLAQGISPENAALAGVYIHGLAGDLCVAQTHEISMMAGDIVNALPETYRHLVSE